MPGPIVKTGDLLVVDFPPAVVFELEPPIPLIGTASVLVNGVPACLIEDLEPAPVELRTPMPYISPPFIIPGMGTLVLALNPANFTERTMNRGPFIVGGPPIIATFVVDLPAMQPTPAGPIPDPLVAKPGFAQIFPTALTVLAG